MTRRKRPMSRWWERFWVTFITVALTMGVIMFCNLAARVLAR